VLQRLLVAIALLALTSACAAKLVRDPLPAQHVDTAQVAGLPQIRFWGDAAPPDFDAFANRHAALFRKHYADELAAGEPITLHFLALSGGAEDGAFGAGLLKGWTASGTRPEFWLVTGVSTGALMAPFVFLGPEYDHVLREIYTELDATSLFELAPFKALFGGTAVTKTEPFKRTIARYVDEALLEAVAAAHAEGRNLFVATSNLDAGRPMIWDLGELADSGDPRALQLFRDILLASAAIPGVFPPVMFDVVAGGQTYDELHVDGGVGAQVFTYPLQVTPRRLDAAVGRPIDRELYVIRNTRLIPAYEAVDPRAVPIAERSLAVLISRQGLGDIFRIYTAAKRDGLAFHLAYIPPEFDHPLPKPFDQAYMGALFELGYEMGRSGTAWSDAPPGVAIEPAERQ